MSKRVIIVGAGVGGLSAAACLSHQGYEVRVLERAAHAGGKVERTEIAGRIIDCGPTVITMTSHLARVFEAAGGDLAEVELTPLKVLARHFWPDGSTLDLTTSIEENCDRIAQFAGAREALNYVRFARYAEEIYEVVHGPFLSASELSKGAMLRLVVERPRDVFKIDASRTMMKALSSFFGDARLIQLFGRYATYSGSDPFRAPATLNVISHVERLGVRSADALMRLAVRNGASFEFDCHVERILSRSSRVTGVRTRDGRELMADAVVFNGDVNALATGLLGKGVTRAVRETHTPSLSALTAAVVGEVSGNLAHHNVFFSSDYRAEFAELAEGRIPADSTVYACASDRSEPGRPPGDERLFLIANAPANHPLTEKESQSCLALITRTMSRCGVQLRAQAHRVFPPSYYQRRFPGTGGAIYGAMTTGMWSRFTRPTARSGLTGLDLPGGSVHPGAGVPMAATSGLFAAEALSADLGSTERSSATATRGGTSTRSATTVSTPSSSLA